MRKTNVRKIAIVTEPVARITLQLTTKLFGTCAISLHKIFSFFMNLKKKFALSLNHPIIIILQTPRLLHFIRTVLNFDFKSPTS